MKPAIKASVFVVIFIGCLSIGGCHRGIAAKKQSTFKGASVPVSIWLTNPDKSALLQKQDTGLSFTTNVNQYPIIDIDPLQRYQVMEGFGFSLTGGSAQLIHAMSVHARTALLRQLFAADGINIGISYLRISIGASDLNDHVYTYDDLAENEEDTLLAKFSLEEDRKAVIPVLKEILIINPAIKILGSPWTPPVWMKTNHNSKGGSLRPEFYETYSRYFVRYITEMKAAGINIDAITIQNEPLHPGNNPSMLMLAPEEATFIKKNLGPAFRAAAINTKIILYDHNADRIDYPISILNDPEARKYTDGSAFHLYGGNIEDLSKVHDAYPQKNLYFTEQWIGAPGNFAADISEHVKKLIIGASRNWCRTVLEWNLAADPHQLPHTDGGCDRCLGGITVDGDNVTSNPGYYIIGHASKFVRPGSVRIASNMPADLPNVAFETPSHKKILIVLNDGLSAQYFNIRFQKKIATTVLKPGAVATYLW